MKRKAESPKPTPNELHAHVDTLNAQRRDPLDFVCFPSFMAEGEETKEGEIIIARSKLIGHVMLALEHLLEKNDPLTRRVLALRPIRHMDQHIIDSTVSVRCWLLPLSSENDLKPNTVLGDLCMVNASLVMIYDNDPKTRHARPQALPSPHILSALNFSGEDAMNANTETLLMNIMALLRAFAQSTPKQTFKMPSCEDGWFVAPKIEKLVYALMAHMFSDDPNWRPVIIKGWTSLIRRCIETDPLFVYDMTAASGNDSMTPGQFRSSIMKDVETMLRTSSDLRMGSDMMLGQDTVDIREIIKEMVAEEKKLGPALACFLGN